jgi:hypothetical protein
MSLEDLNKGESGDRFADLRDSDGLLPSERLSRIDAILAEPEADEKRPAPATQYPALEPLCSVEAPKSAVEELCSVLRDQAAWIKHRLEHLEHRNNGGNPFTPGSFNSWAVSAIPDWELRQKLDNVTAALSNPDVQRVREQWEELQSLKAFLTDAVIYKPTGERKSRFQPGEMFMDFDGVLRYFSYECSWTYAEKDPRPIYKAVSLDAARSNEPAPTQKEEPKCSPSAHFYGDDNLCPKCGAAAPQRTKEGTNAE